MTLDCSELREELVAFDRGELAEDRRRAVEEHLRSCRDCADVHRLDQAIDAELAALDERDPIVSAPGFAGRVRAALDREIEVSREPRGRRVAAAWFRVSALAAAAVLLCVGVWWVSRPDDTDADLDLIASLDVIEHYALVGDALASRDFDFVLALSNAETGAPVTTLLGSAAPGEF